MKMESLVDLAAQYMSETVLNDMSETGVDIVHSVLVIYTGCKRSRSGRVINSRINAMLNNIEDLDLDFPTPTAFLI